MQHNTLLCLVSPTNWGYCRSRRGVGISKHAIRVGFMHTQYSGSIGFQLVVATRPAFCCYEILECPQNFITERTGRKKNKTKHNLGPVLGMQMSRLPNRTWHQVPSCFRQCVYCSANLKTRANLPLYVLQHWWIPWIKAAVWLALGSQSRSGPGLLFRNTNPA